MAPEIILTNARVVTPGEVVRRGTVVLRDGLIVFEGDATDLRKSGDRYLQTFLS